MIHIATVHWQTDKWIDTQLKYLKKNIKENYRVYAFLNGIDQKHNKQFYYSCNEDIQEHYIKLNLLGEIIKLSSKNKDEDLIFFLDGDAFPIGDIVTFVRETISSHKLVAIQRVENGGDIQPHPSFCATTISFWEEINGTWKSGYEWINNRGNPISDVGGDLLKLLSDNNINWLPLLRTSQLSSHPLWFGIYKNLIYHHGAGFRIPFSRYDIHETNFLLSTYYNNLNKLPHSIRKKLTFKKLFFKQNIKISENIYNMILSREFYFDKRSLRIGS